MNQADSISPSPFPAAWADSFGQDDCGFWQGVVIADIDIRLRWIPPGEFMMGSPDDEPELERYADEGPQHKVSLRGFWLAETACTQALWQAVMVDNPSRFKGDDLPVENVDWDMAQTFIEKINADYADYAGLCLQLPTEAQWEYACRAGTTTAFEFGDSLSTDQANYDGNHPYHNGKKGEYREKTVAAKHFAANRWGLYQMHGNVWEWCEDDWHDDYTGAPTDGSAWKAQGKDSSGSGSPVCRGGSWIGDGGDLRGAYRAYGFLASGRRGFRLARGPEQPVQE